MWDYQKLPAALGCKDWFTTKVRTNGELEAAMEKANKSNTASYIEIVADKHDYPDSMKKFHSRLEAVYGI